MRRLSIALLLSAAACASVPRPADTPEAQRPDGADRAIAENCARQADHGIACAIALAIERAGSTGK